ncbi:hypothetical protein ANCDUO_27632 [Ancylostoma duodenale]|uniref:Uncharacterized protein n=1 Tax=Ancylostoma duodenale TaxID=51022 RepID=A0A0C2BF88_9BILA|nr:hypothetical protein ANCDUO_27632 [Ancylostoma duodenale]
MTSKQRWTIGGAKLAVTWTTALLIEEGKSLPSRVVLAQPFYQMVEDEVTTKLPEAKVTTKMSEAEVTTKLPKAEVTTKLPESEVKAE